MNKSKRIHERYHSNTRSQTKIISDNNFTYKIILTTLKKHLKKEGEVLDVGCGAGTISLYLAYKGYQVTGIDISKKAIKECQESAKKINLRNVTFYTMNFPDEVPRKKFDFIVCSEVIEHIENRKLAFHKMYSLLKPRGILFLTTPSSNAPLYKIGYTKEFDKRVGHVTRYSIESLSKEVKQAGFEIEKVYKTEGLMRNFLFVSSRAGKLIRFIRSPLVPLFTVVDNVMARICGESQIVLVARR